MNGRKQKGKGGGVGIVVVLGVLMLLGVGAAVLLKMSMSKEPKKPVTTVQKEKIVAPSTRLVEAPPPLPEDPPVVEEEVEQEVAPKPEPKPGKPRKKALPVGTIDKKAAQAVTKKNYTRVRACYEKQLKVNNLLQGNLMVRIVIYPDGSVNSVKFTKDSIHNQTMNSCIKKEIMHWSFPKPEGGKAEVHVPYRFEPKAS